MSIRVYTFPDRLVLSIPRDGLTRKQAQDLLKQEATKRNTQPEEGCFDGVLLGEGNEPTLYVIRANRLPEGRRDAEVQAA